MTPTNNDETLQAPPKKGTSLLELGRRALAIRPVERPDVSRELPRLQPIERAGEVFRYSIRLAEHWLSPGGTLRAVLRLSMKLGLLIAFPTLIIGPALLLALDGVASASALLAASAASLAAMSFWLIAAVIGFALLIALVRTLLRRN